MSKKLRFLLPSKKQIKNLGSVLSRKEKAILFSAIFILIGSLVAWGVNYYLTSTEEVPGIGGEYTEGMFGQPKYINPILRSSDTKRIDGAISQLIFSSLMTYNQKGELVGDLVDYYQVSPDGKTYEFKIKENILWHDKTQLTAKDISFTVALMQDPSYRGVQYSDWEDIEVREEGDYRIVFELPEPDSSFLHYKATRVSVVPKHIFEKIPKNDFVLSDFNLKPIGSGPFKFSNFEKDSEGNIISYQLLRNSDYYRQNPYLEKINFNFYVDEEMVIDAYNKKEINGFQLQAYQKSQELKQRKDTQIHTSRNSSYWAVFFNKTQSIPLSDEKVRKALRLATNKQEIINQVLFGYGQEIDSPIFNAFPGFNSQINLDYNPEEAKKLLEEAGWKLTEESGVRQKEERDLEIEITTRANRSYQETARLLKKQWEEIGAKITITSLENDAQFNETYSSREYAALLYGNDYLSNIPRPYLFWHSEFKKEAGRNSALYSNGRVDKILEEAQAETNPERIKDLYREFETVLSEDSPATFLFNPEHVYVMNKKIKNVGMHLIPGAGAEFRMANANQWYIKTIRLKKESQ